MPYTRRDLLRDAALISATGVVAGSPFILGCHTKPTPPPPFSGVRVFFSGAWIFCSAPKDSHAANAEPRLYAIARDMKSVPHKFPYGAWQDTRFDSCAPSLPEGQYRVDLDNFTATTSVCATLQSAASGRGPFRYLSNSRNEIKLDTTKCGLRIISLPVPTCILPAAYLTKASFVPTDPQSSILSNPPDGASYSVQGLPTAHILEYAGAKSLNFSSIPKDGSPIAVTIPSSQHFHVHTIVDSTDMNTDHARGMFANLLGIFYRTELHVDPTSHQVIELRKYLCDCDLQLINTDATQIEVGPNVPPDITPAELEIFTPQPIPVCNTQPTGILSNVYPFNYHLASCSGSGFGVDGDVSGNESPTPS
jgi:hypothetical protein